MNSEISHNSSKIEKSEHTVSRQQDSILEISNRSGKSSTISIVTVPELPKICASQNYILPEQQFSKLKAARAATCNWDLPMPIFKGIGSNFQWLDALDGKIRNSSWARGAAVKVLLGREAKVKLAVARVLDSEGKPVAKKYITAKLPPLAMVESRVICCQDLTAYDAVVANARGIHILSGSKNWLNEEDKYDINPVNRTLLLMENRPVNCNVAALIAGLWYMMIICDVQGPILVGGYPRMGANDRYDPHIADYKVNNEIALTNASGDDECCLRPAQLPAIWLPDHCPQSIRYAILGASGLLLVNGRKLPTLFRGYATRVDKIENRTSITLNQNDITRTLRWLQQGPMAKGTADKAKAILRAMVSGQACKVEMCSMLTIMLNNVVDAEEDDEILVGWREWHTSCISGAIVRGCDQAKLFTDINDRIALFTYVHAMTNVVTSYYAGNVIMALDRTKEVMRSALGCMSCFGMGRRNIKELTEAGLVYVGEVVRQGLEGRSVSARKIADIESWCADAVSANNQVVAAEIRTQQGCFLCSHQMQASILRGEDIRIVPGAAQYQLPIADLFSIEDVKKREVNKLVDLMLNKASKNCWLVDGAFEVVPEGGEAIPAALGSPISNTRKQPKENAMLIQALRNEIDAIVADERKSVEAEPNIEEFEQPDNNVKELILGLDRHRGSQTEYDEGLSVPRRPVGESSELRSYSEEDESRRDADILEPIKESVALKDTHFVPSVVKEELARINEPIQINGTVDDIPAVDIEHLKVKTGSVAGNKNWFDRESCTIIKMWDGVNTRPINMSQMIVGKHFGVVISNVMIAREQDAKVIMDHAADILENLANPKDIYTYQPPAQGIPDYSQLLTFDAGRLKKHDPITPYQTAVALNHLTLDGKRFMVKLNLIYTTVAGERIDNMSKQMRNNKDRTKVNQSITIKVACGNRYSVDHVVELGRKSALNKNSSSGGNLAVLDTARFDLLRLQLAIESVSEWYEYVTDMSVPQNCNLISPPGNRGMCGFECITMISNALVADMNNGISTVNGSEANELSKRWSAIASGVGLERKTSWLEPHEVLYAALTFGCRCNVMILDSKTRTMCGWRLRHVEPDLKSSDRDYPNTLSQWASSIAPMISIVLLDNHYYVMVGSSERVDQQILTGLIGAGHQKSIFMTLESRLNGGGAVNRKHGDARGCLINHYARSLGRCDTQQDRAIAVYQKCNTLPKPLKEAVKPILTQVRQGKQDAAKRVSEWAKTRGIIPIKWQRQLTYLHCLVGKTGADPDWKAEAKKRCRACDGDGKRWGPSVERIEQVLGKTIDTWAYQWCNTHIKGFRGRTFRDHWTARSMLARQGAASGVIAGKFKEKAKKLGPAGGITKAAAFAAGLKWLDVVKNINNGTIRAVKKMNELAKARALYPVDIYRYLIDSYLVRDLEPKLFGPEVDLNDTPRQLWARERRRKEFIKNGYVASSYDFEDFNSQHSLRTMAKLIRGIAKFAYSQTKIADYLLAGDIMCKFLFNQKIIFPDGSTTQVKNGLLSGWRLTTIINTMCNSLYTECAIKISGVRCYDRVCHGDDYVGIFRTIEDIKRFEIAAECLGCRAQRSKLMRGSRYEYLRCMHDGNDSSRSLARAIGNMVCGNWESDSRPRNNIELTKLSQDTCSRLLARGCSRRAIQEVIKPAIIESQGRMRFDSGGAKEKKIYIDSNYLADYIRCNSRDGMILSAASAKKEIKQQILKMDSEQGGDVDLRWWIHYPTKADEKAAIKLDTVGSERYKRKVVHANRVYLFGGERITI